jgi:C_GCAxxG_C_C family probable redox protein
MHEDELTPRVSQAIALFESGYNCSQAVFMAYADIYKIEEKLAAGLSTSFGGGMGRMREVCGALSGACMLLGLEYPHNDPSDKTSKDKNYKVVQRLAETFKTTMGSYICADLLELKREPQMPESSERTPKYYDLRPCTRCVAVAAEIVGQEIGKNHLIQLR